MEAKEFTEKTGAPPTQDDLERVNCSLAGQVGHSDCGWCKVCDLPHFACPHDHGFVQWVGPYPKPGHDLGSLNHFEKFQDELPRIPDNIVLSET